MNAFSNRIMSVTLLSLTSIWRRGRKKTSTLLHRQPRRPSRLTSDHSSDVLYHPDLQKLREAKARFQLSAK